MNKQLDEKRKKTELVLSNIYNLPAMSAIMVEVSRLLDDPSTGTQELSSWIGKDQGLATKILSIANSPLYGLPRKVSTIDFAILIIGYQDVKNIVVALSMIESFKSPNDKNLDQNEFWLHSVVTGNAAKRVAEDLGYRIGGEAFVAGLLHDLGIPVINKYLSKEFKTIVERFNNEDNFILNIEKEELGLSHQEIGKFLTNKWNLPKSLCTAVLNHHEPGQLKDEDRELTAIVHLADYMTQKLNLGSFYWDNNFVFDEAVLDILKFEDINSLDKFIEGYRKMFEEEIETFKI
ncbi:MAG: HDOD domain-containing protein [Ignavibacteria bacterium]